MSTVPNDPYAAYRYNPDCCEVCRGTGKSYLEHPDGSLTEVVCGYCKGRKDSTWVKERFQKREHNKTTGKWLVAAYFAFLIFSNGWPFWSVSGDGPAVLFALHCLFWLGGFAAFTWVLVSPKLNRKPRVRKHAPGFTEPREKLMGGAFVGGALLKGKWDQTHKH